MVFTAIAALGSSLPRITASDADPMPQIEKDILPFARSTREIAKTFYDPIDW
jgi:hypothetical protein